MIDLETYVNVARAMVVGGWWIFALIGVGLWLGRSVRRSV